MRLIVVMMLLAAGCGVDRASAPASRLRARAPIRLPKAGDTVYLRGERARVAWVVHNGLDGYVAEVHLDSGQVDTARVEDLKGAP